MGRIPSEIELRKLYIDNKQSLSKIAEELSFSVHKITYWMSAYKIPRRSQSDAVYIKLNPNGEPFRIKKRLTRDEVKLKYLALGLYWGEGNKTTNNAIRVTNSDPGVIRQFINYLRTVCNIREDKIRFYLQTFKDNNLLDAKKYWGNRLDIESKRINTTKPIHSMGIGTYKRISKYGVMTVGVFNLHLKKYIMNELEKLGMK